MSPRSAASAHTLITGANTGIGFETARGLLAKGHAVDIACRDVAKGAAAAARLRAEHPAAQVGVFPLDLGSMPSIRAFVETYASRGGRTLDQLDVLVLNAGVMACPQMKTASFPELQLGTNHFGHFLLTSLLAPLLLSSPAGRVVVVSSAAHAGGTMNFRDLAYAAPGSYNAWAAYAQSKLANVLFVNELARRAPASLTVNALHPGVVATDLGRHLVAPGAWWAPPVVALATAFLKTPSQGAATSIYLASSPDVGNLTGQYFSDCAPARSSAEARDEAVARRLWGVSNDVTGAAWPVELAARRS